MIALKIVWRFFRKYWYLALLAAGFMVAEVYVDLYQPKMMAVIVDEGILGIGNNGVSNLSLVVFTGIKMLLVVIAGGIFGLLSALFTNITGQGCGNDIRKLCFNRIMHFSFEQTDDFSTGSLITRITNDVTQVQQLIMQMIRGFVRCLMFFIGALVQALSVLAWIISNAVDGYDIAPLRIVYFLLLAGCAVMMLIGAINGFRGKIKVFPVIGAGLFFLCDLISFLNNRGASNGIALAASTLLFVAILLIAIFAKPKDE